MKKYFAIIALLAIISAPAFAVDGNSATVSTAVSLVITDYCELSVDAISQQTVSGGAREATFSTNARSRANFDYLLTLSFAWTSTAHLATAPELKIAGAASKANSLGDGMNVDPITIKFVWTLTDASDLYAGTITVNLAAV